MSEERDLTWDEAEGMRPGCSAGWDVFWRERGGWPPDDIILRFMVDDPDNTLVANGHACQMKGRHQHIVINGFCGCFIFKDGRWWEYL